MKSQLKIDVSAQESTEKIDKTGNYKLRRTRSFKKGQIQSGLPSVDCPSSRAFQTSRQIVKHPLIYDAREGDEPLNLDDVVGKVLCGDSAKTLSRLPDGFVSCAITSPPYWNLIDYGIEGQIGKQSYEQYRDDLKKVWAEVSRCLAPNGKFVLNVPPMPIKKEVSEAFFGPSHTRYLLDLYADLRQDILASTDLIAYSLYIWEKQTTEKMFGSYPYPPNLYERNYIEFIAVFVKPGKPRQVPLAVKEAAKLTQKEWLELTKQIWWMYPENVSRKEGHPAPFPEALPNRLISMYTFPGVKEAEFPGDIVLDPFNGWGTTCVAAKRMGRRFIGIDLSPEFCHHAAIRLASTSKAIKVMKAEKPSQFDKGQQKFFMGGDEGDEKG